MVLIIDASRTPLEKCILFTNLMDFVLFLLCLHIPFTLDKQLFASKSYVIFSCTVHDDELHLHNFPYFVFKFQRKFETIM